MERHVAKIDRLDRGILLLHLDREMFLYCFVIWI